MSRSRTFGDRRGTIAAVVTAVLLVLGGWLVVRSVTTPGPPPQPDSSQGQAALASAAESAPPSPRPDPTPTATQPPAPDFGPILKASDPVGLRIPSIELTADSLVALGLDDKGELEAPQDPQQVGWYAAGPAPGEFGPSVIAAHVDSRFGPAVFYHLGAIQQGAEVMVLRADGSTATFVVDRVERYAKAAFPTSEVYADTGGRAELRLITCGGDLDPQSGHYLDNVVAYAHLVV